MNQRLTAAAFTAALLFSSAAWADDPATPAAPAPEANSEDVWVADFDKAVAIAKKEKKDLFVDFTGSDWCTWCIRLHKEVFEHDAFLTEIRKQYVLVALDFERDGSPKKTAPNPARNAELQKKHEIQGFPTILLMTSDGDVFGQIGYAPGGPEKYVQQVGILREEGIGELTAAKELTRQIKETKGPERTAACEKAIAALRELTPDSNKIVIRANPVKAALAADPENKDGIAAKALLALFRVGVADEAAFAAASKYDPKNEGGLLEQAALANSMLLASLDDVHAFVKRADELFATGELKDKTTAKKLYISYSWLYYQHLGDPAKALEFAKKAQAIGFGPAEDRMKQMADQVVADEGKPREQPRK